MELKKKNHLDLITVHLFGPSYEALLEKDGSVSRVTLETESTSGRYKKGHFLTTKKV